MTTLEERNKMMEELDKKSILNLERTILEMELRLAEDEKELMKKKTQLKAIRERRNERNNRNEMSSYKQLFINLMKLKIDDLYEDYRQESVKNLIAEPYDMGIQHTDRWTVYKDSHHYNDLSEKVDKILGAKWHVMLRRAMQKESEEDAIECILNWIQKYIEG